MKQEEQIYNEYKDLVDLVRSRGTLPVVPKPVAPSRPRRPIEPPEPLEYIQKEVKTSTVINTSRNLKEVCLYLSEYLGRHNAEGSSTAIDNISFPYYSRDQRVSFSVSTTSFEQVPNPKYEEDLSTYDERLTAYYRKLEAYERAFLDYKEKLEEYKLKVQEYNTYLHKLELVKVIKKHEKTRSKTKTT